MPSRSQGPDFPGLAFRERLVDEILRDRHDGRQDLCDLLGEPKLCHAFLTTRTRPDFSQKNSEPSGPGKLARESEKIWLKAQGRRVGGSTMNESSSLHERIAEALGWTVEDTRSVSYQGLRELVRPVSQKLAAEITGQIHSGEYLSRRDKPRRRGHFSG